ncbi:chemotaxis protein CheA [Georgenia sp. H159]|uniref:chemotaxis protein CheA n=1 Tax=Georgenia sp. H159 TaxID=3076115 RepID=UPI002D791AE7|nr:chemotaxis protein CheA [Georgenia sp. H159]
MDEIVHEFLVESYENLDQLDQDLVALESAPTSRELLSSIFRTVHTIKGTSGFLGYASLERVSHTGEGLLSELRDGVRLVDQATTDVLLALVDTLRAILASIEAGRGDAYDVEPTISRILALQQGEQSPVATEAPATETVPGPSATETGTAPSAPPATTGPEPTAPQAVQHEEPARKIVRRPVAVEPPSPPAEAPAREDAEPAAETSREPDHVRNAADSSIRVDIDLLDTLMRQVGELVLVRNQFDRLSDRADDPELSRSAQRLSLIATELQEGVMKTRMQPIEHVWNKMPRVVRDLASMLGRKVSLSMLGGETELDRSLLEAVKDPLTHLVRNAVDHGIESPEERVAAGKREQGHVTLRAYHAGGQVIVEIADDGHGIDADAVAASAVAKGLRTEEQVRTMSAQEIFGLLFLPGFSTAKAVTNVSGRGVGMDVVRTKIEAIGGSVDVESQLGLGTTWRLRIPLTLAIMPALTVQCVSRTFAIAQTNLLELVAVESTQLEYVGTAPVYRLRGALLPLVSLAEVLGLEAQAQSSCTIAVLQADDQRFGLLVDRVLNNEEIVVKAISSRIKQIGLYSGATVLGDGDVALILDVQAIARRALVGEIGELVRADSGAGSLRDRDDQQLLVVAIGEDRRVAIPLADVTRLERMPAERIERVGNREVVQYRGDLLPVARLDNVLGATSFDQPEELLVTVLTCRGVTVAVVVGEIVDIVTDDPTTRSELEDTGLTGSTVIKDRVTELLDVSELLHAVGLTPFDVSALDEDLVRI